MRRYFGLIVLSGLLFWLALPLMAQDNPSQTQTPLYAEPGPYSVGRTWFILGKGTGKPIILLAMYPALKQEGDQSAAALTVPVEYELALNNIDLMDGVGLWQSSALNAIPDSTQSPYPLVVYSPGYGASPRDYISIEEHLASYGFIVIGIMTTDRDLWSHYIERPALTSREIDFAEGLTGQDGSFKGMIDTKHIAVVGHSSGGYTALAAAGAQFNLAWLEDWCSGRVDTPSGEAAALSVSEKDVCSNLLSHKDEMLALAKLDAMPTTLWPSWGDQRVTAIVSQSGDGYIFGSSGMASVTIPVMVQVGSADTVNTPEWSANLTYNNVSSAQKSEVVFDGGDHGIFGDWGMGVWDDLINHFTTAFLLDTLKGDQEAHMSLLVENVNFPHITYATTMK